MHQTMMKNFLILLLLCSCAWAFHAPSIPRTRRLTTLTFSNGFVPEPARSLRGSPNSLSTETGNSKDDLLTSPRYVSTTILSPLWRQHTRLQRGWRLFWRQVARRCQTWRRGAIAVILAALLVTSGGSSALAAVTGGRAGGTFKSTQRPTMSRRLHAPPPRRYPSSAPRVIMYGSPRHPYVGGPTTAVWATSQPASLRTRDVLVIGSVAGLLTYGMVQSKRQQGSDYIHQSGATSTALMLALQIPDRTASDSIVQRINAIAQRTDTSTSLGVQTLISEVCLELVRQQASILASWTESEYHTSAQQARQEFQRRSVANRSRYDQETLSNFNAQNYQAATDPTPSNGKATYAVVSVHYVTEGQDTPQRFQNSMRADVVNQLRWTAATVPVATLLAGEVLWSPQTTEDTLSKRELDERYPELLPLI